MQKCLRGRFDHLSLLPNLLLTTYYLLLLLLLLLLRLVLQLFATQSVPFQHRRSIAFAAQYIIYADEAFKQVDMYGIKDG